MYIFFSPCSTVFSMSMCILITYYVDTRAVLAHCVANGILEIPFHKFHCWFYILFFHL